jgi:multiple sugar transport system permease protein
VGGLLTPRNQAMGESEMTSASTALNAAPRKQQTAGRRGKVSTRKWLPVLLTAPAFFVPFALTLAWILGVYWSLTDYDLRFGLRNYVGLANYINLITKQQLFWTSLKVTAQYTLLAVGIELPVSLAFAMMLNRATGWTARLARSIVMAPLCISPVIATIMWKIMLGPNQGLLNYVLHLFGAAKLDWFGDPRVAMYSLIMIDCWLFIPFTTLILWGGLQSLPKAPYEAAAVDGASPWFTFRKLTLPLMKPFVMIATLFRVCDSINAFDTIYASTKGGPMRVTFALNVYGYDSVMRWHQLGYGLAIMMVTYFLAYAVVKRLITFFPR